MGEHADVFQGFTWAGLMGLNGFYKRVEFIRLLNGSGFGVPGMGLVKIWFRV